MPLQGAAVRVVCALWSRHGGAMQDCRCRVLLLVLLLKWACWSRCSMPLQHAAACRCRVPGRSCRVPYRVLLQSAAVQAVCVIWGHAGAVCALELACWCRCRVLLQGAAGRVVRALWAWVPPQGAVQGAASGCCC